MEHERDEPAESQTTRQGHEIPVPRRDDFFRSLEKVSEPEPEDDESETGGAGQ